jgi:predicted RNase H-like HicB family nuclease
MKPREYLREPYTRILVRTDEGYSAEILEFPGCFAQGHTADEAMTNLEGSTIAWITACQKQGIDIPEPFMNQGFGGKIALRLPRSLHRQVARLAKRDNVSLNQFLVSAIAAKVGADEFYQKVMKQIQARMGETTVQILHYAMNNTFQFQLGPTTTQMASSASTGPGMGVPFAVGPMGPMTAVANG